MLHQYILLETRDSVNCLALRVSDGLLYETDLTTLKKRTNKLVALKLETEGVRTIFYTWVFVHLTGEGIDKHSGDLVKRFVTTMTQMPTHAPLPFAMAAKRGGRGYLERMPTSLESIPIKELPPVGEGCEMVMHLLAKQNHNLKDVVGVWKKTDFQKCRVK